MATDSAPARRPQTDPTKHVWQVPTFVLGLAAFAAAWQGWLPLGPRDPATAFLKDIAALKAGYEKLTPEPGELNALLKKVASAAEGFPEHTPAAHFTLGSGYVRLAELTANPEEARNYWYLARQHFESVRPEQFTNPADPPRLAFRTAKAKAAIGVPPNTSAGEIGLLQAVLANVPAGDDPGEAGRLIADLALRLNPPDLKRARDGLAGYVAEAGLATPTASLARAKLRLGEIHILMNEPEPARRWLSQIGADAPPDVFAPTKTQLARILMADGDWAGAAKEWEQLRAAAGLPVGVKPVAAYHLGVCRLKVNATDATVAKLFEEAVKAEGAEGPAATVRLAEAYLRNPDPAKHRDAVPLLAGVVKGVIAPTEFANPLLPVNELQAAFEQAVQVLQADQAFDAAVKATEAYKPVAVAGREREKRAEVFAAWGTAQQKAGADPKPKFAVAADEYAALAAAQPKPDGKAEMLRRAATLYRQAGSSTASLAAFDEMLKLPGLSDDFVGPMWVEYADGLLAANRPDDALKAFQKAMTSAGAASTAARYRLARLLLDSRNTQKMVLGLELLKQVADANTVTAPEQGDHERALVELAHEFIRANNFPDAEARLRKQLNYYPGGPEAGLGRLLLGVCLLQRATRPNPEAPEPAQAPQMREEALKLFEQVVAEADARAKLVGKPPEREAWLKLQAQMRVLQTYQQMGRPDDLLKMSAGLKAEYRGTVEELIVLSLEYHAHKQANQPGLALETRDKMKELFEALKAQPAAFKHPTGEYSKDYWEKVWFTAEK